MMWFDNIPSYRREHGWPMFNGIAPLRDVWTGFLDGILAGSFRKAVRNAALALADATAKTDTTMVGFTIEGENETKSVSVSMQTWFKPEKLSVIEVHEGDNKSLKILNPPQTALLSGAFIGSRNLFPTAPGQGGAIHLGSFGTNGPGTGLFGKNDKMPPGGNITFQIQFTKKAKIYGNVFGKTIG